jgi:hypothetical protein
MAIITWTAIFIILLQFGMRRILERLNQLRVGTTSILA